LESDDLFLILSKSLAFYACRFGFEKDGIHSIYRGADKSLARPGRKQPTATEDFDFHISYL